MTGTKVGSIPIRYIPVKFNEKFANFFDIMQNGDISNRKSDTGYIEKDRPMFWPRRGSLRVGDTLINDWVAGSYNTGKYVVRSGVVYRANLLTSNPPPHADWTIVSWDMQSNLFFYTDVSQNRMMFRVFDQNLYYLNGSTWTNIKALGTNQVDFTQHKVPVNAWWADSTSRTMPSTASAAEKVKRDAADSLDANNNVGSIILITSGIYKWCFAPIISYDATGWGEYTLWGSGAITILPIDTTYKRFTTLGDVLQVTRGASNGDDLYFYGATELTYLAWYATASLKNVSAITASQSCKKTVIFNNGVWTYSGSTLYYAGWFPGNPLFFNYVGSLTPGVNGSILDILPYKNRLVVIATNSIFSIKSDLSVDRHITAFGGYKNGYVNTGDDIYILTTNQTVISLSETINGVVDLTNVGETIDNFVKNFKTNIAFGYDSRRIYLYGQSAIGVAGTMCVYDTKMKMWLTYTWLSPMSIVSDSWKVYINDNNSDIVRYFDASVTTDVSIGTNKSKDVAMALSLKEIDDDDPFTQKTLREIWIYFEEYAQILTLDTYLANTTWIYKKPTKEIVISPDTPPDIVLAEGTVWENTFWFTWSTAIMAIPIMRKVNFEADSWNVFKLFLSGKSGTPFYISRIDIWVAPQPEKVYINPLYSI